MTEEKQTFIAIKNWDKFQADNKGAVRGPSPWIKDWTAKEEDLEYSKLSIYQRYFYDALRRLRGKLGKNPNNDPSWIGRVLGVAAMERQHIGAAIKKMESLGLIQIVDNSGTPHQQDSNNRVTTVGQRGNKHGTSNNHLGITPSESSNPAYREDKSREDKSREEVGRYHLLLNLKTPRAEREQFLLLVLARYQAPLCVTCNENPVSIASPDNHFAPAIREDGWMLNCNACEGHPGTDKSLYPDPINSTVPENSVLESEESL